MQLGEMLRLLRNDDDLKLRELSDLTGMSISYLSDLENGRTEPSLQALRALALAYNTSVVTMLSGVDRYNGGQG